jgi:hypothetical protein
MVLVESLYIEAISCSTLQPKPIAALGKIPIGKYLRIYGIRGSAHELVGSVLLGHDEVFHDIGFALWTGELLGKQSSGKENDERCQISHRSTSRMKAS